MILDIFSHSHLPFICLLGGNVCSSLFCHSSIWIICFLIVEVRKFFIYSKYIFCQIWDQKKISPGQCLCHFILLTVSFKEQKFFIFMKSNLSTFSFMNHAFLVMSKNSLPNRKSLESFKNFIFRSMIYLVQSVMFGSRFIFLTTDVQLFQHHLLKRLSFLHQIAFAFLSKVRSVCAHLFLVSLLCSTHLASTTLFWLLQLYPKLYTEWCN